MDVLEALALHTPFLGEGTEALGGGGGASVAQAGLRAPASVIVRPLTEMDTQALVLGWPIWSRDPSSFGKCAL